MKDFIIDNDLIPMVRYMFGPGLLAGVVVLLTRKLSARAFWSALAIAFAAPLLIFSVVQIGHELMNGPLATALLVFMIPASLALGVGRSVRRWSLPTLLASAVTYTVVFVFTFSFGVNIRWLGKPF